MWVNLVKNINLRLDQLLSYPGIDEKKLSVFKTCWMAQIIGLLYMILITILKLIVQPNASISLFYCGYLIIVLIVGLSLSLTLKRHIIEIFSIVGVLNILVTFIFILKNGGLQPSYSYLFIIFFFVLMTIPVQKRNVLIASFSLFTVLTVMAALIGSSMKAPPEKLLSPFWNEIISVINVLSTMTLGFILVVNFMRKQQQLEQREAARQKELNEAKTRLFTNITHEFRTPLTVIRGMAGLIHQKPEQWIGEGTERIRDNSNMMLRLVNQLLDISKIEAKAMPVNMIQGEIARYIGFIIELYHSAATGKGIELVYRFSHKSMVMDFDPFVISQILTNLLGNAIKYTDANGRIEVESAILETEMMFILTVTDSGKGIPADKLKFIFDRFYQADEHATSGGGTGLGLALAKELAALVNGSISAESEPGKGSAFTVRLPVTRTAEFKEDFPGSCFREEVIYSSTSGTRSLKPEGGSKAGLPLLLIVEDSRDVMMYLSAILCSDYHVELAANGREGLEKAIEKIPDIILSDVMMPEMDGIEMLGRLKNDFRTSHIPVVMLTAKADIASRLEGLERGADAYITKPFNESELHIQLRNLIGLRKKLHERYASLNPITESHDPALQAEDAFMGKVRGILDKNLDNDEFNINDLCRELAVSHTQLYRKFKSVSSLTVAGYLKLLRLHKAKELLSEPGMNVTQIAFETGFRNLSHFSREFASLFGESPRQMRKHLMDAVQN